MTYFHLKSLSAALAFALLSTLSLFAAPADHVIDSLKTLDVILDEEVQRQIRTEVEAARERADDKNDFDQRAAILADMASLSTSAQRASARVRLVEMHRQLIEDLLNSDSAAIAPLDALNPMVEQFDIGVGMTKRDLGWAVMLEAMRTDLPEDPRTFDIKDETAKALANDIVGSFHQKTNGKKQFLSRVDAWAFGTMTAWRELSPEERQIAVSVIAEDAVPARSLLTKVIGTPDVVFWLAGVDIGLSEAEQEAYPALHAFMRAGHLAGGVESMLTDRLLQLGAAAQIGANANLTLMMMELNYDLLFGHELLGD